MTFLDPPKSLREYDPERPPDYVEDTFFGLRWSWMWEEDHYYPWMPERLRPCCPAEGCGKPMYWESGVGAALPRTEFTCPNDDHPTIILNGTREWIRQQVVEMIDRRWRFAGNVK
jgi:hypothetical protein